jgi:hypothetical protein
MAKQLLLGVGQALLINGVEPGSIISALESFSVIPTDGVLYIEVLV